MKRINTSSKYNRIQDSELNIESIISAPLIALSKANTLMLNGQTFALLNQYFIKIKKKDNAQFPLKEQVYQPKMINMVWTQKSTLDQELNQQGIIFQVPLISIAPLNSIAIQKITIAFNLDITSITSYVNTTNDIIERKAQLNGKISNGSPDMNPYEKYRKSNQRSLKINIQAGNLPLPLGVLSILELYSKNIQPFNPK
ncbi:MULTISPECIES: DUF2589 domain-containing protein [unclassified Myroides]|uniref:DUF2589 domain-containing protein n=1 Tax=unclassified Myroides TaxID=2642485 RepID=UPI002577872D|nr:MULTISPECIES: DUF2589 domain-containing protein [unclassified Myroides]